MDQGKIGKFIANLRKEKNMTQQDLGEKLGVSFKTVSKWETGRGMPDLSLFNPLCEELGITINELLSGEKLDKEGYQEKFEENIVNTIDYTNKKMNERNTLIGIILLVLGFMISFTKLTYSPIGLMIALIGVAKLTRKLSYLKRLLLHLIFVIVFIVVLLALDFESVIFNRMPPKFSLEIITTENVIAYYPPFYNVYRINRNTKNEYYIIDMKKQYTIDNVPISPFNRTKSGIDNIKKYQNSYMGNASNTGNLIGCLPLSEYGYVTQMNPDKLELTIDYHITDWYINDNYYLQQSLLYNSVSLFSLIDNMQTIHYNFTGNSYTITRKQIEEAYPNYTNIKENNQINEEKFNELVESKMNDTSFVQEIFQRIFKHK